VTEPSAPSPVKGRRSAETQASACAARKRGHISGARALARGPERASAAASGELPTQLRKALGRRGQRLVALGESEAQHSPAELGAMVEARTGHRSDADLVQEEVGGLQVVVKSEFSDVGHDVVGTLRDPAA